jgi:hypothetical protein
MRMLVSVLSYRSSCFAMLTMLRLSPFWKSLARSGAPIAAILIPAAFFLSVVFPTSTQPNGLMNLAYIGALFLAAAVLSLGVGLIDLEEATSSEVDGLGRFIAGEWLPRWFKEFS